MPASPVASSAHGTIGGGDGVDGGKSGASVSGDGILSVPNADSARDLDAYLNSLLTIPAVVQSQVFSGFLDEHCRRGANMLEDKTAGGTDVERGDVPVADAGGGSYGGEGAPRDPETAIDFLVQPFDYTNTYVPRRGAHTESIDVLRGESVVWKFEVLDSLDIDFSVVFRPHPVAVPSHNPGDDGDESSVMGEVPTTDDNMTSSPGPKDSSGADSPPPGFHEAREEDSASGSRRWSAGGGWWSGSGKRCVQGMEADGNIVREFSGGGGHENETSKEKTVHLPTRYSTGEGDPVQGSFTCPAAGT